MSELDKKLNENWDAIRNETRPGSDHSGRGTGDEKRLKNWEKKGELYAQRVRLLEEQQAEKPSSDVSSDLRGSRQELSESRERAAYLRRKIGES
jgi:hypothetical protein